MGGNPRRTSIIIDAVNRARGRCREDRERCGVLCEGNAEAAVNGGRIETRHAESVRLSRWFIDRSDTALAEGACEGPANKSRYSCRRSVNARQTRTKGNTYQ